MLMPGSLPHAARLGLGALVVVLAATTAAAEDDLPVLHARSTTVDVQDGGRLLKGVWIVDPDSPLDVFHAERTTEPKKVTFRSDVDALSFDVEPGRTYDFMVLLEGGGKRCRTRISTRKQVARRVGEREGDGTGAVTIPFQIVHGKPHVTGTVNGSRPLDLLFDTGADIHVLYPSARKLGAELVFDGTATNVGTGGAIERRTSGDNRLEVGGLLWEHEPFLYIEKQADDADGILGYTAFVGKVVEFDQERGVMVIHDALPEKGATYARVPMAFAGTLTAVEADLGFAGTHEVGSFLLDTGGNGTMNVNAAFAKAHGLYGAMERLGTSASGGVGGGIVRNEVLMLPELTIAGYTLRNVPIHVELPSEGSVLAAGMAAGTLNVEVLRRFNTFLDYRRYEAWFTPNARFAEPFEVRVSGPPWTGIAAIGFVAALGVGVLLWRRRRTPNAAAPAG